MNHPRMSRALLPLAVCTLLLTGCASTGSDGLGGFGRSAAQSILNQQCHSTLAEQRYWQMAKLALTAARASEIEREVCTCASEEAASRLTPAQMVQLSTDQGRAQVVTEVLVPTLTTCYQQLATSLF